MSHFNDEGFRIGLLVAMCAGICSGQPAVTATAKGPNQINLTWPALPEPGYGYSVEIQSATDARYASWTVMPPIPTAAGYTCDPTVVFRDARCNTSDPAGAQVYNPPVDGVPYWVTEANYTDPQDDTPAQFIAWGLKPGTAYRFRARTWTGNAAPVWGAYSNEAEAATANYTARFVSLQGSDTNDGSAADPGHAWRTLTHATAALACGQVLMVAGGAYTDTIGMAQNCTADRKAVVLVSPGESATIVAHPGAPSAIHIAGTHVVIDGLKVSATGTPVGEYDVIVDGSHNALLNVELHPTVIPSFHFGMVIQGGHNLLYRSYLHDYGSPDERQNPSGNGGFPLAVLGGGATHNAIWSNHLTRGGHDTSLCKSGCSYNRWLNNVMDGGWGQGWIGVYGGAPADRNLVEGNIIKGVGQLVTFFKPAIQVSGAHNTVRRNTVLHSRTWALEVSSFEGGTAGFNLIYNNVFYAPGSCYFQSSSRGYRVYYGVVYANNICYRFQNLATDIYSGNTTNRIVSNDLLEVDAAGKSLPGRAIVIWNHSGGGAYETPQPLAHADRNYQPFARNLQVSVAPGFVDEKNLDLHLNANSLLVEAGVAVGDSTWGSAVGTPGVGPFEIAATRPAAPIVSDAALEAAMREARAGNYEAALAAVRARPQVPGARLLEAALNRALFEDEAAAAALAAMPAPGSGDLAERFERLRQNPEKEDKALWDELGKDGDRLLQLADRFVQWGLYRDALELLSHEFEKPLDHPIEHPIEHPLDQPLALYYRGFCRDRLDYPYYAAQDFQGAAASPLKAVAMTLPAAPLVLEVALERDPSDATARYLLATALEAAGDIAGARDAARNAAQLRPGFTEAAALLEKLGPGPASSRSKRVVASSAVGTTPTEIAVNALMAAVGGNLAAAMARFNAANFPQARQDDVVRDAYFELRLQRLLNSASAHQCPGLDRAIAALAAPDPSLPFTAGGFAASVKSLRTQYLLGTAEAACGNEPAARARWEPVSKSTAAMASTDYAFPILALAKSAPAQAAARARFSLDFVHGQLSAASAAMQPILLFNQGQLEVVLGRKPQAAATFQAGAQAGQPGMTQYLNLDAIQHMDR